MRTARRSESLFASPTSLNSSRIADEHKTAEGKIIRKQATDDKGVSLSMPDGLSTTAPDHHWQIRRLAERERSATPNRIRRLSHVAMQSGRQSGIGSRESLANHACLLLLGRQIEGEERDHPDDPGTKSIK